MICEQWIHSHYISVHNIRLFHFPLVLPSEIFDSCFVSLCSYKFYVKTLANLDRWFSSALLFTVITMTLPKRCYLQLLLSFSIRIPEGLFVATTSSISKFSTRSDLFTRSLWKYGRAHLLLPRLPSRSKRVSHFELPGFIALSCQQDHPLGDHSRTFFRIFTAKTYIETKLRMPISQTGLVFPT